MKQSLDTYCLITSCEFPSYRRFTLLPFVPSEVCSSQLSHFLFLCHLIYIFLILLDPPLLSHTHMHMHACVRTHSHKFMCSLSYFDWVCILILQCQLTWSSVDTKVSNWFIVSVPIVGRSVSALFHGQMHLTLLLSITQVFQLLHTVIGSIHYTDSTAGAADHLGATWCTASSQYWF